MQQDVFSMNGISKIRPLTISTGETCYLEMENNKTISKFQNQVNVFFKNAIKNV